MDLWTVLDIKSTTDISAIKRAYAAKSKIFHPEDDPEGFQRLRLAYETALRFAKCNQKNIEVSANVQQTLLIHEPSHCNQESVKILPQIFNTNVRSTAEEIVKEFIDKVRILYDDPNLKNDVALWKNLLKNEEYWNIEIKQKLNLQLLQFLADPDVISRQNLSPYQQISPYRESAYSLPPEVWEFFNTFFFWTEQERELYKIFPTDFLDFVWEKIYFRRVKTEKRKLKNISKRYVPSLKTLLLWIGNLFLIILAISLVACTGAPGIGIAIIFSWLRYKYSK